MNKDLTTLFTGRNLIFLKEVDSTNSYLVRELRDSHLAEGTAVMASRQIAGRGQSGAHWESEDGKNILVSFVFYPSFIAPKDVFLLNKAFALAVCDFTRDQTKDEVKIKWPNDIYWNDLKVAGILIENSLNSTAISHCILGIGINVNQTKFSSPLTNPVSLSLISGEKLPLPILFNALCSFIEARYLQLKYGERSFIVKEYEKVLYAVNEWKTFRSSSATFKGCIRTVDENGRLVVEREGGQIELFNAKEVAFQV